MKQHRRVRRRRSLSAVLPSYQPPVVPVQRPVEFIGPRTEGNALLGPYERAYPILSGYPELPRYDRS